MARPNSTKEQQDRPVTAQSLAKDCYERAGTTEAAAQAMRDLVLDNSQLTSRFSGSAFLVWAHHAVQSHVSALRRQQLKSSNDDAELGKTSIIPRAANIAVPRRTYSGHRLVAEATLFDMPIFGKRLGDSLRDELIGGAESADLRIASMKQTNRFARAVADAMKNASLTVEQQLDLGTLEEIQATAS